MAQADQLSLGGRLVGHENSWAEAGGHLLPQKVFTQPFRLALKKNEDITWIEVRSLDGLRSVVKRIENGELEEIDRFSSLEIQLWGFLAEHTGFLRVQGSTSMLAAGIQPLGEEAAALAEDLSTLSGGGDIEALDMLGTMKDMLSRKPIDRTPLQQEQSVHAFVKPDGINLTERGEDALHELVFGGNGNQPDKATKPETIAFEKGRENAIEIFLAQTPAATPEEIEAEKSEAVEAAALGEMKEKPVGRLITGPGAKMIGHHVAEVGRGLDNTDDMAVRLAAQRALEIMGIGPDGAPTDATSSSFGHEDIAEVPLSSVEAFANHFGISVEDLLRLATATRDQHARPSFSEMAAQIKRASEKMLDMNPADFLAGSEPAEAEDEQQITSYECPDPEDPYGRNSKPDNDQQ